MRRLTNYLNSHFFSSFLTFLLPLFGIASLIFFVKIVSMTSIIRIDLLELLEMFFYLLPQILFFTLSISFFIAAVSTLYRLSYEFELIATFALGISPNKILKPFFKQAILLSIILSIFGLILIPQAKQLYKGFITHKKRELQLNIKPNDYGHKFGSWLLFIQGKQDNHYIDVALYSQDTQKKENFILASKATISNSPRGIKLTLFNGKAFSYDKETLQQITFEKMEIYDRSSSRVFHYTEILNYWKEAFKNKKRAFDMTFFLFIAFFPLSSIYLVGYLGITNTRYERRNIFFSSLMATLLYFALAFGVAKPLGLKALIFLPIWMLIGYILFRKKILKRY